jgi:hypothetical protein
MKRLTLTFRNILSAFPSFLISLIPIFKACPPCPLCMPKYAAILSLLGLPLADYSHYLTPLMLLSMAFTLWSLHYQAKKFSFDHGPFCLCLSAIALLILNRFLFTFTWGAYGGLGLFFIAIVWNQQRLQKSKAPHSNCSH